MTRTHAAVGLALFAAVTLYAKETVIEEGKAQNGVTWCLRLPPKYDPKKGMPAILILHGSNMNSKDYVATIVGAWPRIADAYVLIGVNGENRVEESPDDRPAYNYSYVNFMGKSRYKGYPGTDRESPALVSEVILELQQRVKLGKVFVGGHSQGGFLSYSLFMNYPDLFAGAFPISAGLLVQCEPTAYEDEDLRARQRRVAVAVVHATNDPAVDFEMGKAAYESFADDGFPLLHLFQDAQAGHMFALLPVDKAIEWLEEVTSDNPAALVELAAKRLAAGQERDAIAAIQRARALDKKKSLDGKLKKLEAAIDKAVAPKAKAIQAAILGAKDDSWVEAFTEFRAKYEFAPGAQGVMTAWRALRGKHQAPAEELWGQARAAWQQEKSEAALERCREIVSKYYASSLYRYAKAELERK